MHAFRGSITWPSRSLSTLRGTSYLVSTQDSLPAGGRLRRAGLAPAGSPRKVSKNVYFIPFPLPQASPGATSAASICWTAPRSLRTSASAKPSYPFVHHTTNRAGAQRVCLPRRTGGCGPQEAAPDALSHVALEGLRDDGLFAEHLGDGSVVVVNSGGLSRIA